jgi:hypothetical protein
VEGRRGADVGVGIRVADSGSETAGPTVRSGHADMGIEVGRAL